MGSMAAPLPQMRKFFQDVQLRQGLTNIFRRPIKVGTTTTRRGRVTCHYVALPKNRVGDTARFLVITPLRWGGDRVAALLEKSRVVTARDAVAPFTDPHGARR